VTKDKVASISASVLLIGLVCYRFYGWITTGQLYLSSRFHPAGQYVSFESDPLGFVLGISYYGFIILAALLMLFMALTEE
jgi:hypothetical protein